MIPTHMYSFYTSCSSQGSMGLASSGSNGRGGPSSVLAASVDSVVAAKREFSGRSHLSAVRCSQTDSVSHLRGTAAYILGREIGEKYGVYYSEVEILNIYRRDYGQPWDKSHIRYVHNNIFFNFAVDADLEQLSRKPSSEDNSKTEGIASLQSFLRRNVTMCPKELLDFLMQMSLLSATQKIIMTSMAYPVIHLQRPS